jgi:hypothetical protein
MVMTQLSVRSEGAARNGRKIHQEPRALMREVVMIRRPRLPKHGNTKVGPDACYASKVVAACTAGG